MLLTAKLPFMPDERQRCADLVGMPVTFRRRGYANPGEPIIGEVVSAVESPDSTYHNHPMMDITIDVDETLLPETMVQKLRDGVGPGNTTIGVANEFGPWSADARLVERGMGVTP